MSAQTRKQYRWSRIQIQPGEPRTPHSSPRRWPTPRRDWVYDAPARHAGTFAIIVQANTRSEARAIVKASLGIGRKGRLPAGHTCHPC